MLIKFNLVSEGVFFEKKAPEAIATGAGKGKEREVD